MEPEVDHTVQCPYCAGVFSVRIDNSAGRRQELLIDCETCCRPLDIEIETEPDGYTQLTVKRQGEG